MKTSIQKGFGLLETMMGLVVFVILAFVGTKAFHNVIANHKEANQIKGLTDVVTATAEKLSALSVATLTTAGSPYLQWSAPEKIGTGSDYFHYRTVPKPTIGAGIDSSVVGLDVETGTYQGGVFTATRVFATLISPHLSSKNSMGQVSTAAERQGEAANYAAQRQLIKDLTSTVVADNQSLLNSFSCYDKGQCCGYMKSYFANPTAIPKDGVNEKCYYRCALAGDVSIPTWNKACGTDFCSAAPWKTSADCCAAITSGQCQTGSVCAHVCVDCVHENGSSCKMPGCGDYLWQNLIDCKNNAFCDGTALPAGFVPEWGDVQGMCKDSKCAASSGDCAERVTTCCDEYWNALEKGDPIEERRSICATISKKEECCNFEILDGWWAFNCNSDGTIKAGKFDGKWYCGGFPSPGWDKYCALQKGCPSPINTVGSASCGAWSGPKLESPWVDPNTGKVYTGVGGGGGSTGGTTGGTVIGGGSTSRTPSTRAGGGTGSVGVGE